MRIFVPIPIRTIPPNNSAHFAGMKVDLAPTLEPISDTINVTPAIIEAASRIFTLMNPKLTPVARASMLVATDKVNKTVVFLMSVNFLLVS